MSFNPHPPQVNVQRSANELEKLLEALEKDMRAMKKCDTAFPH